jgi:protein-ribulosamine 3-kinase
MFFKNILEEKLSQRVLEIIPISGGDINEVYSVKTSKNNLVLKKNNSSDFPQMFEKEKKGLESISKAGAVTPEVVQTFENSGYQFLLLEFIEEGDLDQKFWKTFAHDLAKIHQTTSLTFGLEYDNYIGSLIQKNKLKKSWEIFFIENRIKPLVKLAFDRGLLQAKHDKLLENLFSRLNEIFPNEKPTLIHGDLWSGNLMNRHGQSPVFIDPAVYFGNREMDIAMTQMFGGFNKSYLHFYEEIFPMESGWEERIEIHNLYPSLVHLNLFGRSYLRGIERVISKFSTI